jgi:hypothetical protein
MRRERLLSVPGRYHTTDPGDPYKIFFGFFVVRRKFFSVGAASRWPSESAVFSRLILEIPKCRQKNLPEG